MTIIVDDEKLAEYRASKDAVRMRKTAPSWAKMATAEDVDKGYVSPGMDLPCRPGIIETLEGPQSFVVGDMICRGVKDELWPMDKENFDKVKKLDPSVPADKDGFQTYYNTNTVLALQINEDFVITAGYTEPLAQTAGAYLIMNEKGCWPLAEDLISTYTPV